MATKESLRKYLENFENEHYDDSAMASQAACPVVINFCDASANGKDFSEATVDFSVYKGFPLACFQLIGSRKLLSYLQGKSERSDEITRLEEFIVNKQHEECLLSLNGSKEYSEYNVKVILAAHLFGPLAGMYEIGNKGFPKDARKCPKCKIDISDKLKNTSLGNGDVWHGYADILVKRCVVKVRTGEDKGVGSDEPLRKKIRTESIGDDEIESSSSDEDHVSDSVVDAIGCHAMSQVLAQTIVNAFAEVNKERKLSNPFVPSFIATSQVIRMTMYNCGLDRLVMSGDLDIFKYDQDKTIINVSTILSVWYALNFKNYFDKTNELFPKFEILYKKSNFKELAGKVYEIYNEKCTKPMTESEKKKVIKFELSLGSFASPVAQLIDEDRSLLRNVIHANP